MSVGAGDLGVARGTVIVNTSPALASLAALRASSAATVGTLNTMGRASITAGSSLAVAGAVIVAGFGYAVKKTAELEKQLSYIKGISGLTAEQLDKLRKKVIQLGQDSAYTTGEVADGFTELSKAGATPDQVIGGLGDAMITLGQSSDIALDKAASALVSISSTFNLAADQGAHIADILQGAANASIISVEDMSVSFKYAGGVAANLGISLQDTATAIAILGNAGIKGSTAGTSLRRILLQLTPRTDKAAAAFKRLGIITKDGANQFYDAEGKAKKFSEITEILRKSTAKLTPELKQKELALIFGDRAINSAIALSKGGADAFDDMYKKIGNVSAADVAAERLNNLAGAWEILKGSIDSALIAVGTPAQKPLVQLVKVLTKIVQAFGNLSPKTQEWITRIALASAVTLLASGSFLIIAGSMLRARAIMIQLKLAVQVLIPWLKTLARARVGAMFAAILSPVGLVVAALALIVGAFVLAYKHSANLRKALGDMKDTLEKSLAPAIARVKQIWQDLTTTLDNVMKAGGDRLAQGLTVLGDALAAMIDGFNGVPQSQGGVVGFFEAVGTKLREFYDFVHDNILVVIQDFKDRIDSLKEPFDRLKTRLGELKTTLETSVGTAIDTAKQAWKDFVEGLTIGAITPTAGLAGDLNELGVKIHDTVLPAIDEIKTAWDDFITGLTVGAITPGDGVPGYLNNIGVIIHDTVIPALQDFRDEALARFQEVADVAPGLFKGIEDQGNDLRDRIVPYISTQLSNLRTAIDDFFNGDSGGGESQFDRIVNSFRPIIDLVMPAILALRDMFNNDLMPALRDAGNLLRDELAPSFNELRDTFVNDLLPALQQLGETIKPLLVLIGGALAIAVGAAILAFSIFVATVIQVFTLIVRVITPIIAAIINVVVALINTVVSVISGIIDIVTGTIQLLYDLFTGNFGAIRDDVLAIWGSLFGTIVAVLEGFWDVIYALVEGLVKAVWGFFVWLYDVLVGHSIIPDMVNAIVQWFQNMWDWVVEKVSAFVAVVIAFFQQLWDDAVAKFQGLVDSIVGFGQTMFDNAAVLGQRLVDGFMGVVNGLKDLVGTAISNAVDHIGDFVTGAGEKAKDLGTSLWEGFKNGMGINSPSYIEKAMFQLTDTTGTELDSFRKQISTLQGLSRSIPSIDASSSITALPAKSLQGARELDQRTASDASTAATLAAATRSAMEAAVLKTPRPVNYNIDTIEDGDSLLRRARAHDTMLSLGEGGDSPQVGSWQ